MKKKYILNFLFFLFFLIPVSSQAKLWLDPTQFFFELYKLGTPLSPNSPKKDINEPAQVSPINQKPLLPIYVPFKIPPLDDPRLSPYLPGGYESEQEILAFCRTLLFAPGSLQEKLAACPQLTQSMLWQTADGNVIAYPDWPYALKTRLNQIYEAIASRQSNLGLSCINPERAYFNTGYGFRLFATQEEAQDIYLAHVAHALFLEISHTVQWSILELPQIQRQELLSARSYFVPLVSSGDVSLPSHIQVGRDFQLPFKSRLALVCDPREAYWFMTGELNTSRTPLVATDIRRTLENLTYWLKDNIRHGTPLSGLPSANLRGRLATGRVATDGCRESAALIYDLARGVNIPLLNVEFVDSYYSSESIPFASRVHQGLVAFAGSRQPRVLYHSDEVSASDLRMFYPRREDGGVMSEVEAKRVYFDNQWASFDTLESWGMRVFRALPDLPNSSTLLGYVGAGNTWPEFGRLLGYWNVYGPQRFRPNRYYELEKAYQLCGYEMVSSYCNTSLDFLGHFDNLLSATREYRAPVIRNSTDFRNKASECVETFGGCESAMALYRVWNEASGSTLYQ